MENKNCEKQKTQNKECFRCEKFNGYYIKGVSFFQRTKLGYCMEKGIIVENANSCEDWCNNNRRLYISKKASLKVLSELLRDISGIRQILQEAQDEAVDKNERTE